MISILVTSAGSAAGISCIKSLRDQHHLECRIIAADMNKFSPSQALTDDYFRVPKISSNNYLSSIFRIAETENIQMILPTHGSEISLFAKNREALQEMQIAIIVPSPATLEMFADKWLTNMFFQKHNIPTPVTHLGSGLNGLEKATFPAIFKPRMGSGERGLKLLTNQEDLNFYSQKFKDSYILQPRIQGVEYSTDVLFDWQHQIIDVVMRERLQTRSGIAMISKTVPLDPEVVRQIKIIAREGKLVGPANIQFFSTDGKLFFTDVNLRFAAGGLMLSKEAGINLPLSTVLLGLGMKPIASNGYEVGLVMTKYYEEKYFTEK